MILSLPMALPNKYVEFRDLIEFDNIEFSFREKSPDWSESNDVFRVKFFSTGESTFGPII